jgi:hypothetical protein
MLAVGADVADPRVTPENGKVSCLSCGHKIPVETASWWELLEGGLIIAGPLACHPECLSGKNKEEIKREARESVYDIFTGSRDLVARH